MFWCDGCEQSDLVSAGVQPVFSHGEEGLESGGESLSGQVKAHSLFCVIAPQSFSGGGLVFKGKLVTMERVSVGYSGACMAGYYDCA